MTRRISPSTPTPDARHGPRLPRGGGPAARGRRATSCADPPAETADVAFLLKLVTTLDRQDPGAAGRLLRRLQAHHAVVSFAARSLGGRGGRERTYRERLDQLVRESGRVHAVAEASVPNELVFVLALKPLDADG
jgi:hypothetical protein